MIGLLLMLALLGVIAWALVTYVPMPQGIKTLIIVVTIVCAFLYVLSAFGVGLPNLNLPHAQIK